MGAEAVVAWAGDRIRWTYPSIATHISRGVLRPDGSEIESHQDISFVVAAGPGSSFDSPPLMAPDGRLSFVVAPWWSGAFNLSVLPLYDPLLSSPPPF